MPSWTVRFDHAHAGGRLLLRELCQGAQDYWQAAWVLASPAPWLLAGKGDCCL